MMNIARECFIGVVREMRIHRTKVLGANMKEITAFPSFCKGNQSKARKQLRFEDYLQLPEAYSLNTNSLVFNNAQRIFS